MSRLPRLRLLLPKELPQTRRAIQQARTTEIAEALAICVRIAPDRADRSLAQIAAALALLPSTAQPIGHDDPARALPHVGHAEHDTYCEIDRVEGEALPIVLRSILQVYQGLLEETQAAGTSLGPALWSQLRLAFDSMLHYLADQPLLLERNQSRYSPPSYRQARQPVDPLYRWRLGHHVFLVVIQNLIIACNCFEDAIMSDQQEEAQAALGLATTLMQGAQAALRFTGDFAPEEYEEIVRPSMMPPQSPPGLSGLLSIDHQHLVKTLVRLKPMFLNLTPPLQAQHALFVQALDETYEAHKFVCARFIGEEQPSLRMRPDSEKSALSVLDQFKQTRLQSVKTS
jgi:hypothetical protein